MMRLLILAITLAFASACGSSTAPRLPGTVEIEYTFDSADSWAPGFTDYPVGAAGQHELEAAVRFMPVPLDTLSSGLMLAGLNHSDDLFMYATRVITDLAPSASYEIGFSVRFASNAPTGCVGAGGAPGESVVVKAGASAVRPEPIEQGGDYRLNVDKGEQASEGAAAMVLGDVATNTTSCFDPPYAMKTLDSGTRTMTATADAAGRLWIMIGVESGFEGRTRIYFDRLVVSLDRVE